MHRVAAKLPGEALLGQPGPRENDQTARVFVDAMNDAERRPGPARREPLAREPGANTGVERVALGLVVGNGADPRGLGHDDHLGVRKDDVLVVELAGARFLGVDVDVDVVPLAHARRGLTRHRSGMSHLSAGNPRARLPPALATSKRPRTARSSGSGQLARNLFVAARHSLQSNEK